MPRIRRDIQKSRQKIDLRGDCKRTAASAHSRRVRRTLHIEHDIKRGARSRRQANEEERVVSMRHSLLFRMTNVTTMEACRYYLYNPRVV